MIKIATKPTNKDLFGKSKWWGYPDLPEELVYPERLFVDDSGEEYYDPLTFICQLRCDEMAPYDKENLLPHEGMLYFFANLDYFMDYEYDDDVPGIGPWPKNQFRVLYSPSCNDLLSHEILFEDGTSLGHPAEAVTFSHCNDNDDSNRLLGEPFMEEVRTEMPGMINLLQIDENDDWDLRFYDCGMLNFLISPANLRARRWDKCECHLFSC